MKCLIILVILMEPLFSVWCKFLRGVIFIRGCQIMPSASYGGKDCYR